MYLSTVQKIFIIKSLDYFFWQKKLGKEISLNSIYPFYTQIRLPRNGKRKNQMSLVEVGSIFRRDERKKKKGKK